MLWQFGRRECFDLPHYYRPSATASSLMALYATAATIFSCVVTWLGNILWHLCSCQNETYRTVSSFFNMKNIQRIIINRHIIEIYGNVMKEVSVQNSTYCLMTDGSISMTYYPWVYCQSQSKDWSKISRR